MTSFFLSNVDAGLPPWPGPPLLSRPGHPKLLQGVHIDADLSVDIQPMCIILIILTRQPYPINTCKPQSTRNQRHIIYKVYLYEWKSNVL
jgi:hypothetical protein